MATPTVHQQHQKPTTTAVMPEISKSQCSKSFNASLGKPVGARMVDKLIPENSRASGSPECMLAIAGRQQKDVRTQ
jgi:hypothetical protein